MHFRYAMGLTLVAGLGLVGCNGGDKSAEGTTTTGTTTTGSTTAGPATGGKTYKIAVIPKGATHEFWKSVHAGANDAGKELGAEITFKGPETEGDRQAQIDIVDNIVSAGTDAIVLAPLDADGLKKPVDNAKSKNIPIVIIDSALHDDGLVSLVATDNVNGGKLAADEMIKDLGGKGNIVMLRYAPGSASTEDREKGFVDEIKAKAPGIKFLSDNQFAGDTADKAQKKSEEVLAGPGMKTPDGKLAVNGIYTPNESSTLGMLATLRAHSWNGKVTFIGFDSAPGEVDALAKGDLNGIVVQNPYKIGYEGVKAAVGALKKEKVETRIDTGAAMITKANMDQPDMQKLLKPKQA